jgi:hypothetical protein
LSPGFAVGARAAAGAFASQGCSLAGRVSLRGASYSEAVPIGCRLRDGRARHLGGDAVGFALEWIVYRADFELRLHR